jgi:hypothetical protein
MAAKNGNGAASRMYSRKEKKKKKNVRKARKTQEKRSRMSHGYVSVEKCFGCQVTSAWEARSQRTREW